MHSTKTNRYISTWLTLLLTITLALGFLGINQTAAQANAEQEGIEPPDIQTDNDINGSNPYMYVSPQWDEITGLDCLPNTEVTLTIGVNQWITQSDNDGFAGFDLSPFDLIAGQTVQMTNGIYTTTHIVKDIAVTEIDEVANSVSGTAEPNSSLHIQAFNGAQNETITVDADPEGHWKADFTIDIAESSKGTTYQEDEEGNFTFIYWHIPKPTITAFPRQDRITGGEWSGEAEITLTIEGSQWTSQSDVNGYISITIFPFDLHTGQVVEMTDGAYTRTYTVEDLNITEVDEASDIVHGTADPNSDVIVRASNTGNNDQMLVTADGSGNWQADFSGSVDLNRSTYTYASQTDDNGNVTQIYWHFTSSYLPVLIR